MGIGGGWVWDAPRGRCADFMTGDAPANLWLVSGTWQLPLSPPPWYPQAGSEVRWELASKAAGPWQDTQLPPLCSDPWRLVLVQRRCARTARPRAGGQARTPARAVAGGTRSRGHQGAARPSWPGTNLCTGEHRQHRANGHAAVPGGWSRAVRGIVATWPGRRRVSRGPRGISPLPSQHRSALPIARLPPLARARGRSGELPAGHVSPGHPLANLLPESAAAFQQERGAPVLTPSTSSSSELVSSRELRSAAKGWEQQAGHGGGREGRLQHTFNSPIC